MTLRSKRQEEFAQLFLKLRKNGILYLCPRFGKCRVGIKIFEATDNPKVLIAYPDVNIKNAWEEEFKIMGYNNPNISFTTHMSLKKYVNEQWDLVVIDEIHLLSRAQIDQTKILKKKGIRLLGLTGTMSSKTKTELKRVLGLDILATYSLAQAVEEGVVTDYRITIKMITLDDKIKFGSKYKTELKQIEAYNWVIKKLEEEEKNTKFLRLNRLRLTQKSIAKLNETNKLLDKFKSDRILVFCGLTDIADKMNCPSYHSKSTDKEIFQKFANGEGDHLAVVKIGNTGTTYKPLNRVIINYFDSNPENLAQKIFRCMAMEYGKDKIADIWLVSTDQEYELNWLKNALEFFDKNKIKYV